MELIKGGLPPKPVIDFWNDYMKLALYEEEVVPEELKVSQPTHSSCFNTFLD